MFVCVAGYRSVDNNDDDECNRFKSRDPPPTPTVIGSREKNEVAEQNESTAYKANTRDVHTIGL